MTEVFERLPRSDSSCGRSLEASRCACSMMTGVARVAMVTTSLVMMVVVIFIINNKYTSAKERDTRREFLSSNQYRSLSDLQYAGEGRSYARLSINTSTVVATVDERFVSVGATMGSFNRSLGQHFNSTRFWTAARGLAPAIYRMGGAEADFTYFDAHNTRDECLQNGKLKENRKLNNYGKLTFHNMTLCAHTWDNINEFARSVGWQVLFCLNALTRNKTSWDPTNALEMIKYTQNRGYQVLWGLGNEPNGYLRKANVVVNGTQMADAFHTLRKEVRRLSGQSDIFLVGPDTSAPIKKENELTSTKFYLEDFLKEVGNATNVTSFHYYYTSGRTANFQNVTDPKVADKLIPNIESVRGSVAKYGSAYNSRVWISESGLTFGGAPSGLSARYVLGMMMLDKLGVSARYGIELIVQQGLIGKTGGLFDAAYKPRLPYWWFLYHKRLMGTRVLDVSKAVSTTNSVLKHNDDDFSNHVRVYAHCTKTSTLYHPGSVTLMIINMIPIFEVHVHLEAPLQNTTSHEYLFTPLGAQSILSPHGKLNGRRLKMDSDYTLPDYAPRERPPGSTIVLPQQSFGFYVLPNAQASVCL
ncbi:heparanase-like [Lytechinus pictus]|uniref:heparanase-like n=1 Tax=Lytechinus pictus TaxID=7653 RepID=UPI0030B9FAC0